MKKTLIICALGALLGGCTQSEIGKQDCEVNNQGNIRVRSIQNETFAIYLNGGYKGPVGAGQTVTYEDITAGTYTIEAREVDYIFSQDIYSASITLTQCETETVNF